MAEASLTDDDASTLIERIRALEAGGTVYVWRKVLYASLPVEGYWRYDDRWQIRPVPPDSPRPFFLMAPHPFLLELKGTAVAEPYATTREHAIERLARRARLDPRTGAGLRDSGNGVMTALKTIRALAQKAKGSSKLSLPCLLTLTQDSDTSWSARPGFDRLEPAKQWALLVEECRWDEVLNLRRNGAMRSSRPSLRCLVGAHPD